MLKQYEEYEVQVSEDAEEFCLAFPDEWVKVGGHSITIGKHQFSAVPFENHFRISEVTSGAKVVDIPVPEEIQSFEETMLYLETVVVIELINLIIKVNQNNPNRFDQEVELYRKRSIESLGEKPQTEKINMEFMTADISEVLN